MSITINMWKKQIDSLVIQCVYTKDELLYPGDKERAKKQLLQELGDKLMNYMVDHGTNSLMIDLHYEETVLDRYLSSMRYTAILSVPVSKVR